MIFGLLLVSLAMAQEPVMPAAETIPSLPAEGRWVKQVSALLYFNASAELIHEIGIGRWEETDGAKVNIKQIDASVASCSRFAWVYEQQTVLNSSRNKRLSLKRNFRVMGTNGKELWSTPDVEAPQNEPPAHISDNGEVLLVAYHTTQWNAVVKNYLGQTLYEVGPLESLDSMKLTSDGRFVMLHSSIQDKSSTHTFIDLKEKLRKDVPSSDFFRGQAVLTEQGQVFSGGKLVFDLAKP